ncbi:uncharacterized protein [Dermacentor andersoni]|uniref:uncharacterized protein n=1 Tax=Dermacentor andersoni TaxID=34620 RepID=UPI003B3B1832
MCNKSFRRSGHLAHHERTHTGERPYQCQVCNKSFRQSSHLEDHKRTHTEERPYQCQVCNISFRQSSDLDRHKRQHTGEKPYICRTCGKSYTRAAHLRLLRRPVERVQQPQLFQGRYGRHTHVAKSGITSSPPMVSSSSINHAQPSTSRAGMEETSAIPKNIDRNAPGTAGREQRELCSVCGTVSNRPDALHGRAKEPTDDTAQICKACDQSSVKKSVEYCHNLTGKKHKCAACGKQFDRAHHLAQHQCTDTDERRYKCNMCKKSFRDSYNLKVHKRTHTDERPHKCQICAKSFRQSSHLDNHKRLHTGEKPYICETCGTSFTQAATLRRHERSHAEEKRHACQKCAK